MNGGSRARLPPSGRRRVIPPFRLPRGLATLTERYSTRGRLAWLNNASTRIGTTLDLERTAQELAEFTVPGFANSTAVDLLESVLHGEEGERWAGPGPPVTRAIALATTEELADLEPDPVGELSVHPETLLSMHCLIARESVVVSRMAGKDYTRVAPTPRAAVKLRERGVHSYLAVPLIARGVLLGVADFLRAGSRAPFTATDVALAEQLASKAAVFIDNARLYGREREHVVSLQRSLLPRATPNTPGLEVSADYAPAADARSIGGDWYDVVALPSGRTALVVGDVMGHGLPAATTMGRLRAVSRTLMTLDIAPDRVLARMDLATRDLEDDQVATCLCAVYDPADGSCTLASAGHPPPLLVSSGSEASFLDVPVGAPLGAGVIPYDPARVEVPAGSHLVLYTDGLIKSRSEDVDTQLQLLRKRISTMDPAELGSCGLLAKGTAALNRFDEAVLLVAASAPAAGETEPAEGGSLRVWDLPSDGTAAAAARRLVTEQLRQWGLSEMADVTELVVSELIGNALRYGDGPGRLRMFRDDRLMVEVSDDGPDLPQIQHAELSDEGGRGLQLINMLCRRWGSCRTQRGKVVWAEQDLPRL